MKLSKITMLAFVGVFAFASCGDDAKKDDKKKEDKKEEKKEEVKEDVETKVEEVKESNDAQYVKDWEEIKKAIVAKDIPGLGKFASSDAVDSEVLMNLANEFHILQVLESYEFKHLKVEEKEGNTYHVFYGYTQQDNDPKKELWIYMSKGETNLMVDYFVSENM
jgi:hypothetical protein